MVVDLRYAVFPHETLPDVAVEGNDWKPEMWQVMRGSWDYSYGGMVDYVRNQDRFGHLELDVDYNPLDDIEGYEDYFDSLVYAKNEDHMNVLKHQINERNESRDVLARASLVQGLTAGLVDPINLVALPFGGPGVGIGMSFLRGAASAGIVQAGVEAGRYATDPTATGGEFGVNVAATAVFGGIISSATSIPLTRRAAAMKSYEKTHKEFLEEAGITDELSTISGENFSGRLSRENRDFGSSSDEEIFIEIENQERRVIGIDQNLPDVEDEIAAAQARYDSEGGSKAAQQEELEQLNIKKQGMLDQKRSSSDMILTLKKEKALRSVEDAEMGGIKNPYDFDSNMFINSPLFKFVTTPMKRILQSSATNAGKKAILQLANDSGLALVANRLGQSIGPSVYQRAKVMEAEWVQAHRQLQGIWANSLGTRPVEPLGIDVTDFVEKTGKLKARFTGTDKSRTYGDFLKQVSEKRIKGIAASNDFEKEAIESMNKFYSKWQDRLEDAGMLGSRPGIVKENKLFELRIAEFEDKLTKYKKGSRSAKLTQKRIDYYKDKVDENNMTLESLEDIDITPANEDVFSPRYWDLEAIKKDRAGLEAIIGGWYKKNPRVYQNVNGTMVRVELKGDEGSIAERAKQTVDKLLGIKDVADPEIVSYGYGKSKHLKSRELDIPTKLVYDYVIQDPMALMKTYSHKTAAVYQFHKMYDGKRLPEVLDDLEDSMILEGKSQKEINSYRKDFDSLYRRIVGSPMSDPSRWDNTMTNVMKDFAYLNYLGSSGFSAIPDFARIVMEHDMGDIVKSLTSILDDNTIKLTRQERDLIGEGLEILQGSSHMRFTEHLSNNPLQNGAMDKARNVYSIANLLGPMTVIAKNMDVMVRGHTIIKLSKQWVDGTITNKDATYLARYNIDEAMAKEIASQPYETTSKGLYLPNSGKWADGEVTETFRTAMQSGVLNTVMMGTPADRPIITDGVVYVPHRIAKMFGYEEDKIATGYSRLESGLLGLPFQFMSYSMAAMNKVTASYSQNQIRNRSTGVLAAMGLGYMTVKIKSKEWAWEEMSASDKFTRAFDQSGLLALYSDLMYTSIVTSMALGHGNYMEGLVKSKFNQEENMGDAITGVLGAGPSIAADLTINPFIDFVNGDYGEGMDSFLSNLPGMRLWFWKDEVNEMTRGISKAF
jgi:hypothetical protein